MPANRNHKQIEPATAVDDRMTNQNFSRDDRRIPRLSLFWQNPWPKWI